VNNLHICLVKKEPCFTVVTVWPKVLLYFRPQLTFSRLSRSRKILDKNCLGSTSLLVKCSIDCAFQ
jgi:hypothetical protein